MYYGTKANLKARQAITDGFFALLSEKRFSKITITDIIQKAGVARSTYYHNFYAKEEIIENYIDLIHQQLLTTENITTEHNLKTAFKSDRLLSGFENSFSLLAQNKTQLLLIYNNGFGNILQKMLEQHASAIFNKSNMKEYYQISFIAGAMQNVLLQWLAIGAKESPKEMAQIVFHLLKNNSLQ